MLRLAMLAVVLAACSSRGYGITYPNELARAYTQEQLDVGVDCLVARVEALGLLTPGAAPGLLRKANITVLTYESAIVEAPGFEVSGRYDPDGVLYLLWPPGTDITATSFQHELVHAILCEAQRVGPTCWGDAGHDAAAWWKPVIADARACWSQSLNPTEHP